MTSYIGKLWRDLCRLQLWYERCIDVGAAGSLFCYAGRGGEDEGNGCETEVFIHGFSCTKHVHEMFADMPFLGLYCRFDSIAQLSP